MAYASPLAALNNAPVITLTAPPLVSGYVSDLSLLSKLETLLHSRFDRFEHEQELSDKLFPLVLEALTQAMQTGTTVSLNDSFGPFLVVGILSTMGGPQFCIKEASRRGLSGGRYHPLTPSGLLALCNDLVADLSRHFKPLRFRTEDPAFRQRVLETTFTWTPFRV